MNKPLPARPYFLALATFSALFVVTMLFSRSESAKIVLGAALLLILATVIFSYIKGGRNHRLIASLYDYETFRGRSTSSELLADLSLMEGTGRKRLERTASMIAEKLQLKKLIVFFREGDRFVPDIFFECQPTGLNRPPARKVQHLFDDLPPDGRISSDESLLEPLFRSGHRESFHKLVIFLFSWGRSRSVIVVADDASGLLADALSNQEFSRTFWPALDDQISLNTNLVESLSERRRLKEDLNRARKDLSGINRELNRKLFDLNSFVRISGDFYSHFDETQLFETLKKTVCRHLGASGAEIMYRLSDGRFAIKPPADDTDGKSPLWLGGDSDLFKIIGQGKAVPLPLVSSGISGDDPFLRKAIGSGFQVAAGIRIENKTAFILIVREKTDGGQYSDSNLDFLSVISNIASLALEKIRQYTTIERLSYTDSMTGVYNYRYFYKRLNEEVLRAKRFNRSLALVILDIDNFKLFNDNYGHQMGDLVLKRLAEIITGSIRSIDVVSRYGGEEFCIIMPDTNVSSCDVFIERLRSEIADFRLKSEILKDDHVVTVSIGGAVYPRHAATPDRIIYCADMALLKAKAGGRNRAIMYQPESVDREESSVGELND